VYVYGHSTFGFAAPNDWNVLQKLLKLETNREIEKIHKGVFITACKCFK